tara:strand:- start:5187 stop:5810 length:624 start_codon:yes stop_codon:yes gene_type:complete
MESGPYHLYDDENFTYIFQHCVHFIGCVNIYEENDRVTGQSLTSKSLLVLKATCHDCLQTFNDLINEWDTVNDAILNKATIQIAQSIEAFQEIIKQDPKRLDVAAKEESLPDIIRRLGLIIETFILHRENLANKKELNMTDKNNIFPLINDSSGQSISPQYLSMKGQDFLLVQFNSLCSKFQQYAQPSKEGALKEESYELKEIIKKR